MAASSDSVEVAPGVRVPRCFGAPIFNYPEGTGFFGDVTITMDDAGQPMLKALISDEPMTLDQVQSVDWGKVLQAAVTSGALDAWARESRPDRSTTPPGLHAALSSVHTGKRSYNRLTAADKAKVLRLHAAGGASAVADHFHVGERQARRMVASAQADRKGRSR
jgi:hypothetical protein